MYVDNSVLFGSFLRVRAGVLFAIWVQVGFGLGLGAYVDRFRILAQGFKFQGS